jgi:hypothetical protein
MSLLSNWANFYVIVGSSAGALTGLTFVTVTLVTSRPAEEVNWGTSTFTTPTIVQFGVVLLICAALSAPWPAIWPAAILLLVCGLGGLLYSALIVPRFRRPRGYEPVLEDWVWYALAPLVAYTALALTGLWLLSNPVPALFGIAAVAVALLFLGIHNAWVVVTYVAAEVIRRPTEREERQEREG